MHKIVVYLPRQKQKLLGDILLQAPIGNNQAFTSSVIGGLQDAEGNPYSKIIVEYPSVTHAVRYLRYVVDILKLYVEIDPSKDDR
jgi:hypothetical protein